MRSSSSWGLGWIVWEIELCHSCSLTLRPGEACHLLQVALKGVKASDRSIPLQIAPAQPIKIAQSCLA